MSTGTFTSNQMAILRVLLDNGSFHDKRDEEKLDIDQIIEAAPYEVTKQAIQFTLRRLDERGYAKKGTNSVVRRKKRRVVWGLTSEALSILTKK